MIRPDDRFTRMLRGPAFPFVLDGLALALFSWPILSTPPPPPGFAYEFLFAIWALMIVMLFLMARSASRSASGEADDA
jgi:hypothetical protein